MPATATIDRSEFLRQQIEDAQSELQTLESRDGEAARVKRQNDELRNFRSTVQATRNQLANFDAQIESAIASMRTLAEGSVITNAAGLITNESSQLGDITRVCDSLKTLILSRARHRHQLTALEDRLAAMERKNATLPKRFQI